MIVCIIVVVNLFLRFFPEGKGSAASGMKRLRKNFNFAVFVDYLHEWKLFIHDGENIVALEKGGLTPRPRGVMSLFPKIGTRCFDFGLGLVGRMPTCTGSSNSSTSMPIKPSEDRV